MSNEEYRQWIENDEGLYNRYMASGLSMAAFIRREKGLVQEVHHNVTTGKQPADYLAYDHTPGCRCYRCQHPTT